MMPLMVLGPYYEYYINYNHSNTFSVVHIYINAQKINLLRSDKNVCNLT